MMINPDHLLHQAKRLAERPSAGAPRQVDLRRAISAAYYGVFHAVLTAAADEFVGATKRSSPQYALVYRSIEHKSLYDVCEQARKQQLPNKYMSYVPASGFGENIQRFATGVIELQERRHAADYDPLRKFKLSDVVATISSATSSIGTFGRATLDDKRAFLALLLFRPR